MCVEVCVGFWSLVVVVVSNVVWYGCCVLLVEKNVCYVLFVCGCPFASMSLFCLFVCVVSFVCLLLLFVLCVVVVRLFVDVVVDGC